MGHRTKNKHHARHHTHDHKVVSRQVLPVVAVVPVISTEPEEVYFLGHKVDTVNRPGIARPRPL